MQQGPKKKDINMINTPSPNQQNNFITPINGLGPVQQTPNTNDVFNALIQDIAEGLLGTPIQEDPPQHLEILANQINPDNFVTPPGTPPPQVQAENQEQDNQTPIVARRIIFSPEPND